MKKIPTKYIPPKVSRYYRFDWQYAVDISKKTSLAVVSMVLLIMPLLLQTRFEIPTNLWLLWCSSVTYIISLIVLTFACPRFIKEYRDYGEYVKRNHSHRFMVWEFYNNLKSLKRWKMIVQETLAKNISINQIAPEYPTVIAKLPEFHQETLKKNDVIIKYPVNINRDIYLPIGLYGEKIVLYLEESDTKLLQKEKELYWILYSEAAKERGFWRFIFWVFIYVSIGLSFLAILNNIKKVLPVVWNYIETLLP